MLVGLCECLHGNHAFIVLFKEVIDLALEVGECGVFGFALLEFEKPLLCGGGLVGGESDHGIEPETVG